MEHFKARGESTNFKESTLLKGNERGKVEKSTNFFECVILELLANKKHKIRDNVTE